MSKRRRYDDKFRAGAVATLLAAGYPDTIGALTRIANELNIPAMTLSRWAKGQNNPPPNELVTEKKEDLADMFENTARAYLKYANLDDVVETASSRDAVMNAAIAVDKMQLLRGLPTEIIMLIPSVVEALKKQDLDPAEVFRRMIERAANVTSD